MVQRFQTHLAHFVGALIPSFHTLFSALLSVSTFHSLGSTTACIIQTILLVLVSSNYVTTKFSILSFSQVIRQSGIGHRWGIWNWRKHCAPVPNPWC